MTGTTTAFPNCRYAWVSDTGIRKSLIGSSRGSSSCSPAVATVGFGYVVQKNAIYKLGDDIKQREQHLDALRKRNVVLLDQVTGLKSPRVIECKVKCWNLGLIVPKESQIVRVPDPLLYPTTPATQPQQPAAPIYPQLAVNKAKLVSRNY